jgi:hypothetical protein
MTIKALLQQERTFRKAGQWWIFQGSVFNDAGRVCTVAIKSFGMFNQVLRVDDGPNLCSGHTIETVKGMREYIRNAIEGSTS